MISRPSAVNGSFSQHVRLIGVGIIVLLALCAHPAYAVQGGSGTLTDVANAFKSTSGGWITTALVYARHLFFALVAIELAWTGVTYVLQRDSLPDFVAQLILKLMGVFFFLALLQNAPTWIPAIIDSFSQAGAAIGGQNAVLDPSSTFGQGLALAKNMLGTLNNPVLLTAILPVLLAVFCAIGVVVAYAIVAGQLMVTLIESYIVVSAGLFFLGFAGSRWTLPFSERYVGYAVSVGIKLFMLYLIVGLGSALAQQWQVLFTPGVVSAPEVYIGVAGSALVFMLLGWQIPMLAASLMNGSPAMTLGEAANVVGTTVSAGAGLAGGALGAVGLGGAAVVAAATAVGARVANPARLEQTSHRADGPIGTIGPTPRDLQTGGRPSTGSSAATSVGGAPTRVTHESSAVQDGHLNPSDASQPDGAPTTDVASTEVQAQQSAAPMQSLDDIAAQLQTNSPSHRAAPSGAQRSVLDAFRGMRIPTLPHDAASGSIHIRFKHHDGD